MGLSKYDPKPSDSDNHFLRKINGAVNDSADSRGILQTVPLGATGGGVASVTRPADTTAYAVGDAIWSNASTGSVIDFGQVISEAAPASGLFTNGYGGYITSARLVTTQQTCTALMRLWIFGAKLDASPLSLTVPADNAAFSLTLAQSPYWLATLDFPALAPQSNVAIAELAEPRRHFRIPNLSDAAQPGTHLYGVLQTLSAFTPASAQVFNIYLGIERG